MSRKMIKNIVVGIVLLGLIVGYYFYLSSRSQKDAQSQGVETTTVQDLLSCNLEKNYPATPREVMRYYNEIQECYYNEDLDDDTLKKLMLKSRELFDDELLIENPEDTQFKDLKEEIANFHKEKRRIFSWKTDSVDEVEYNTLDGENWASIRSCYVLNTNGIHTKTTQIFLMKKVKKENQDRWKIYGWDIEENKPE